MTIVSFNIFMLIKCAFVGHKNFDVRGHLCLYHEFYGYFRNGEILQQEYP
jgi:hypothetical protein